MTLSHDVAALLALATSTRWEDEQRIVADLPVLHERTVRLLRRVTAAPARQRLAVQAEQLAALRAAAVQRESERHAETRRAMAAGTLRGTALLAWLDAHPAAARDLVMDQVLGVAHRPLAFTELEEGLVDHLPSSTEQVVRAAAEVPVTSSDVFVDVGAGLGKAALLMHLLTGARARGIELQHTLVQHARENAAALGIAGAVTFDDTDARAADIHEGTVFYMYRPFVGPVLDAFMERLRALSQRRAVRICALGMDLSPYRWLRRRNTSTPWLFLHDAR